VTLSFVRLRTKKELRVLATNSRRSISANDRLHRCPCDRVRHMLGAAFVEHAGDLWPQGEPGATPEWIRAHVDDILAALMQMFAIGRHGRPASLLRVPRRMHWLLWLLGDLHDRGEMTTALGVAQEPPFEPV
jgi:hypothetical protein